MILGSCIQLDREKIKGYKITKYDPSLYGPGGRYMKDTWTSVSDIGKLFGGTTLTAEEYENVESKYLTAVALFAEVASIDRLRVCGLEIHDDSSGRGLADGQYVSLPQAIEIYRQMLREEQIWCRLEEEDKFYVHIGYDYYMYLGVSVEIDVREAVRSVRQLGLFVAENWLSPYLPE